MQVLHNKHSISGQLWKAQLPFLTTYFFPTLVQKLWSFGATQYDQLFLRPFPLQAPGALQGTCCRQRGLQEPGLLQSQPP